MKALSGVRVLDLSRVLAGPWSTQILADLGAEVVKIERPGEGDDTRHWGPPNLLDENGIDSGESAYFQSANRGKQSVAIDISSAQGQALVRALALKADVLVENYKVGGLASYGLDYESLKLLNPRLIYCSITGFGQTGPYAQRPGYDAMIQAMGGLMSLTGDPEGEPAKVGVALTDISTGLYATIGILAALHQRQHSGEGQYIDLALLDVQVATLANQGMNFLATGVAPERRGNAHPSIVPYQVFAVSDGHLMLAVGNDEQFRRCCDVLGMPEWGSDDRFATNSARVAHRDALVEALQKIFLQRQLDEWLECMEIANVPCGPINTLDRVFANPQVKHRKMKVSMHHSIAGEQAFVASPLRLSASPVEYESAPPLLGQHGRDVLSTWLGIGEEEFDAYSGAGVVGRPAGLASEE